MFALLPFIYIITKAMKTKFILLFVEATIGKEPLYLHFGVVMLQEPKPKVDRLDDDSRSTTRKCKNSIKKYMC